MQCYMSILIKLQGEKCGGCKGILNYKNQEINTFIKNKILCGNLPRTFHLGQW